MQRQRPFPGPLVAGIHVLERLVHVKVDGGN